MRRRLTALLIGLLLLPILSFAEPFQVQDIRIDGLQRIDLGTALRGLDIDVGDTVDEYELADASRSLFATGYFNDVRLARDGSVLIVKVAERPALSRIDLEGNDTIESEVLLAGLANLGLSEGEVFQRATLERIRLELSRLYAAQGRYNAWIDASIEELPENRVGLTINIKEGQAAAIQHINIIGNSVFDDETLKEQFELRTPGLWSFFLRDHRYAREKLSGDLERLRSYYLNRGYLNFNIESTQVSLTPDRKHVYITVNVTEGELYHFGNVELAGQLPVDAAELQSLLTIEEGEVFSRERMVNVSESLSDRLGWDGYLQTNVNPVPQVDEEAKRVDLKYMIEPGNRMYVRRINFRGNKSSADEVLRREMRQMEGGYANSEKIEQSKQRIERLGYFANVNVETQPVPGTEDQVDLEYSVEEQLSGNLSASVGFSQSNGLLLGLRVAQKNFLGTGRHVSFSINNSDTDTEYNFRYTNPYYTIDGVSRGFNLFYRKQDFDENDVSNYKLDSFGGGMEFGYPIDDYQRLNFGLGYKHIKVREGEDVPDEISDFVDENGDTYNQFPLTASWTENRLNRGLLATSGFSQSISLEATPVGSDLGYYKARYRGQRYFPLDDDRDWIVHLDGSLGYAGSLGNGDNDMPFFEHFFTGGLTSVRGFENNSIGPRATNNDEDPLGGNVLVQGSMELIFPFPLVEDRSKLRSLVFMDVGNVYDLDCNSDYPSCNDDVDFSTMRASVGVGVSWITFLGPLSFSLAAPVQKEDGDETEIFQFALGRTF